MIFGAQIGLTCSLLLPVLLCVPQSPLSPASKTQTITASIEDVDVGQPVANSQIQVQLFPPEHGARKILSQFCVPSDDSKPLFTFAFTTDPNGAFSLTAPAGDYLAKVSIPQRRPIFGCVFFDTEESVRRCNGGSSRPFQQYLFVRTANSVPGFSGDILGNNACAPHAPQPCEPLRVPNLVKTNQVTLGDFEGSPMRNANLEFREYTKGAGKLSASLVTDASGVVDVSGLEESGGLLRMSVHSERASGEFLIDFAKGGLSGQQAIKLFHWRCRGELMQGAIVQP